MSGWTDTRTDTERLDWLERGSAIGTLRTDTSVYVEMDTGEEWVSGTFRDVIDAAMDAEERG